MAKETAKKFLFEYAANPEAMKLLNEYPQPETLGDGARILSEIAGKMGIAFTAEEMTEAIGEAEAARKARTDAAAMAADVRWMSPVVVVVNGKLYVDSFASRFDLFQ